MKNLIKIIITVIFAYTLSIPNAQAANSTCMGVFSDVKQGELFCPYAEFLYHQKILSGDKNDGYKFKTNDNLTRGQLAKIIKTAFQLPTNNSGIDFPDVSNSHTFYNDIKTLRNAKIISGNSQGNFDPNGPVTRGAMMKFILNAARYRSQTYIASSTININEIFPDVTDSETFKNEIRDVYALTRNVTDNNLKIINGFSDGGFHPGKNVTRGQAAKIISNTLKTLNYMPVACSDTFCQDKFTGPIVSTHNVYNDGKIRLQFPEVWTKSSTLTKFLFAYEFNSGVQSIVGEKTDLNYVLDLTDTRCRDLGKEIQAQLSSDGSTFDEVTLSSTQLLTISDNKVCKVALTNKRDNIQILQNIYILVINSNEVYQIVTTSGSGNAVDENIIKTLEVLV